MPTKLKLAKTLWGVPEAGDPAQWDGLFARIKVEGFDGIEAIPLTWRADPERFKALLSKHALELICQIHTTGGELDPATGAYIYMASNKLHDHLASFVKLTAEAKSLGAVLINSHSGHDSWGSGDKAKNFLKMALKVEAALGVPVVHETHRQRLFSSPYTTTELLEQPELSALRLNANLSHWCCVCERLFDETQARDDWWPHALELLAKHADLVHARVGHAQGPQVSDPDAPEFIAEVSAHAKWWRTIWTAQAARHADGVSLWAEPEHGPPPYLQTLPHTQQPVADLCKINARMAARVRTEHAKAMEAAAAAAAAAPLAKPTGRDFIPGGDSERWGLSAYMGPKPGYVFLEGGPKGVGYYREDLVAADVAAAAARPQSAPPLAPPKVGGKDGALLQAAMGADASLAAGVTRAMGGGGAETAAPPPEDAAARALMQKASDEGTREAAAIARAAAAAEGGVSGFISTSVQAADGDVSLLQRTMAAMNVSGAAAAVGKLLFSPGAEQLSMMAYVPAALAAEVDVLEWVQAVLGEIGGKIMLSPPSAAESAAGGSVVVAAVAADAATDNVPRADMDIGLKASADFLRSKGKAK